MKGFFGDIEDVIYGPPEHADATVHATKPTRWRRRSILPDRRRSDSQKRTPAPTVNRNSFL
jgi:hypothetical protein